MKQLEEMTDWELAEGRRALLAAWADQDRQLNAGEASRQSWARRCRVLAAAYRATAGEERRRAAERWRAERDSEGTQLMIF